MKKSIREEGDEMEQEESDEFSMSNVDKVLWID